jgi:hypothetical protein
MSENLILEVYSTLPPNGWHDVIAALACEGSSNAGEAHCFRLSAAQSLNLIFVV